MRTRFLFPEGKNKALTMSYDDGVVADRRLVDIFNRHNIKGTFHLNSSTFGNKGKINPEEVATLYAGHEVSCHAVTHPFLERLPHGEIMREVWEDRKRLEELAGYPVLSMSYPYGTYNDEAIATLRAGSPAASGMSSNSSTSVLMRTPPRRALARTSGWTTSGNGCATREQRSGWNHLRRAEPGRRS